MEQHHPEEASGKYGLVAGNGKFPFLVLEAARSRGVEMIVAAVEGETFPEIEQLTSRVEWLGIGQLGKLIKYFKREGVTHALMAGQVKHTQIFSGKIPDWRMAKVLTRLARKNTDSLIGGVVEELASEGITFVDSTAFLKPLLPETGVLTKRPPSAEERSDIEYGLEVAHIVAGLDLGQSIAVADRAVVAVEAMEGTDEMIMRAGSLLKGRGFSVVKVAKPKQDMRFDVPVVGVPTVEAMACAGATALSITAGKTLMFGRAEMISEADRLRIAIVSTSAQQ